MKIINFFGINNTLIFLMLAILRINIVLSFNFYRSFALSSGNAILANVNGIYHYNLTTHQEQEICLFPKYLDFSEFNTIIFAQFSSENGYVISSAKNIFYLIKNEQKLQCKLEVQVEISNVIFTIIPIKYENSPNEKITFAYAYIQTDSLNLEVYELQPQNENDCIKNNIKSVKFYLKSSINNASSTSNANCNCQLMYYSTLGRNIITCFYQNKNPAELATISFDIDNDYEPMNELLSMTKKNTGANYIDGNTNDKKTKALICYTDIEPKYYCIVFDLNKKEWSNYTYLYSYFSVSLHLTGVIFNKYTKEYIIYSHKNKEINFIRLNENFEIINSSNDKKNCMAIKDVTCVNLYGDVLLYSNVNKSYYYISSFKEDTDKEQSFKKEKLEDLCNSQINGDILFYSEPLNETDDEQPNPPDNPKYNSTSNNDTNSTSNNNTNTSNNDTNSTYNNDTNNSTINPNHSSNDGIIINYTNKTIDIIVDNLEELLENIEIGKVYKLLGEDYEIKIKPINYIDQKNATTVDLKECGEILKNVYKLSKDTILTILQIEMSKKNEQSLTNQVEYAVFDEEKNKLNLSYCNNISIIIYHEIKNNSLLDTNLLKYYTEKGVDVLNLEDDFFNDLCYPYSENDTDLILNDRILDIYQNFSICDTGCEYKNIDIESMVISCQCNVKEDINTDTEELTFAVAIQNTFKDSNFGVIRCYNFLLDFNILKSNIGFWCFTIFFVAQIPLFLHYFINGITDMKKFITNEMKIHHYIGLSKNNPTLKKNNKKKNKIKYNNLLSKNGTYSPDNKIITTDKSGSRIQMFKNNVKIKKKYGNRNNQQMIVLNFNNNNCKTNKNIYKNKLGRSKNSSIINSSQKLKYKQKKSVNQKNVNIDQKNYKDYCIIIKMDANNSQKRKEQYESKYILDNYEYNEAVKYETRSFWRIFLICLFYKESFLNSFLFKSPLLLKSLRISLLIFHISCDFSLNALFYFNNKISDRYNYDGETLLLYSFINNMVITICSTLVSFVLQVLFRYLIDSKREIRNVFKKEENNMKNNKKYVLNNKDKYRINQEIKNIFKKLKIKILVFILLEFLMMVFFYYFVSAFCYVYNGTQYSWLYDSFTSLLFSILIKVLICFFLSSLYVTSIKYHIEILYKIGMFIYELG